MDFSVLVLGTMLALTLTGVPPSTSETPVVRQRDNTDRVDLSFEPPNGYFSRRFGFLFNYPDGYVIDSSAFAEGNVIHIDLWTEDDYNDLQAGEFAYSEPPPNTRVSVATNPEELSLEAWVENSNWFVDPQNFTSIAIDGQEALAFTSTGLYESECVVLQLTTYREKAVMAICLDADGTEENPYEAAYDRILSTLSVGIPPR